MFNPYNSYSWTSCLFSTLNTIKKILKDIQYTYDCKLKKICEMLSTTLEHNQHDVIDVIWRLPVWNVKIRYYLASCTLQVWYNLTKISFQGKLLNYLFIGWKSGSPDTILEGSHPRTIPPKFGCNWPSGFWGEDFYVNFP